MDDVVIALGAATLVGGYLLLSKKKEAAPPAPRIFALTDLTAAKAPPLLPPPDFPPPRKFPLTHLQRPAAFKSLIPGKQPRTFPSTGLLPHKVPASFKPVARVFGTTKTHRASKVTNLVPERTMFDQKCAAMPEPLKPWIKAGTTPQPLEQSDFNKYYYQFSNWAFPYDRSAGGSAAGLITSTTGVWPLGGGGGWGPRIWGPESNTEGYVAAAPAYSCAYKYQDANNTEWWYIDDTQKVKNA